jgi:hypothetical protein
MGMADARVFDTASEVLDHLLDGIDARAPGMIVGTYITGSIALGDGRPGKSDIDLVMIRDSGASNESTMAALEPALADLQRTRPRPMIDGLVLDLHDLEAGPDRIEGERPVIFDNVARLSTDASGRNPVTWQTLRQCGIAWRGTPLDPNRLWHDPERLNAWTRGNLESYWRPWLASRSVIASVGGWSVEWGVLGVTRLHYTLATGRITSKHGAGGYALDTFPERWHRIVREALRIREGRRDERQFRQPFERRRHMREYVAMVIDDALALPPHGASLGLNNP